MHKIRTFSGGYFDLANPHPSDVRMIDVAHSLATTPRYTGQAPEPYSIAQHSVLVARLVRDLGGTLHEQQWGLIHDAGESYVGDWSAPLKALIRSFSLQGWTDGWGTEPISRVMAIEPACTNAVARHLGLDGDARNMPKIVKQADEILYVTEARDLFGDERPSDSDAQPLGARIMPWAWQYACEMFMLSYRTLFE